LAIVDNPSVNLAHSVEQSPSFAVIAEFSIDSVAPAVPEPVLQLQVFFVPHAACVFASPTVAAAYEQLLRSAQTRITSSADGIVPDVG